MSLLTLSRPSRGSLAKCDLCMKCFYCLIYCIKQSSEHELSLFQHFSAFVFFCDRSMPSIVPLVKILHKRKSRKIEIKFCSTKYHPYTENAQYVLLLYLTISIQYRQDIRRARAHIHTYNQPTTMKESGRGIHILAQTLSLSVTCDRLLHGNGAC